MTLEKYVLWSWFDSHCVLFCFAHFVWVFLITHLAFFAYTLWLISTLGDTPTQRSCLLVLVWLTPYVICLFCACACLTNGLGHAKKKEDDTPSLMNMTQVLKVHV